MAEFTSFAADAPGVGVASKHIDVSSIDDSPRYKELDWLQAHFDCSQHDHKTYDFDGRVINAGPIKQQQFLSEQSAIFVPLKFRRPCAPVRLAKSIVNAFTSLVFGDGHFPRIKVPGDFDSEDFKNALCEEASLPTKFVQARNLGGAMGTVALSWRFKDGSPRVRVQNAKDLWVQEWLDREQLIPAWVTKIYKDDVSEYNFQTRKYEIKTYWYRRDWTLDEEVVFKPIPYEGRKEPDWLAYLDQAKTVRHNDGICHLIWIQNLPSEDIDGVSDFHGQLEALETMDLINSVLVRGTTLNLDPTLVMKMDPSILKMAGGFRKGSDNALVIGESGDVSYLELSGGSVDSGIKLLDKQRMSILEATQCVLPDPNEVAAGSVSSVALKTIYRPMIAQGGVLREQYGKGIKQLLEQQSVVARLRSKETISVPGEEDEEEEKVVPFVALPPRIETEPVKDEMGQPTGEESIEFVDRTPGNSDVMVLDWPEWFPPTPQDRNQLATTLQLATGGKAFISKQSAIEEFAIAMGRDPKQEIERTSSDKKVDDEAAKQKMQMFGQEDAGLGAEGEEEESGGKPNPFAPKEPKEKEDDSEV